jgi:hypothetical protein
MGRYAAKNKKYAALGKTPAFPRPSYAKIQKVCGIRRCGAIVEKRQRPQMPDRSCATSGHSKM